MKFKDIMTKNSQIKNRLNYLYNLGFFDNHISVLMVSILAGGLMGILVVSCISIRHEENLERKLYGEY